MMHRWKLRRRYWQRKPPGYDVKIYIEYNSETTAIAGINPGGVISNRKKQKGLKFHGKWTNASFPIQYTRNGQSLFETWDN